MKRLRLSVLPMRSAAPLRHTSTSSSASESPPTQTNSKAAPNTPLTSHTATGTNLHTGINQGGDIADRVAAGRSPHLNAAYQAKWQRTSASSSASDSAPGSAQRQRQRSRRRPSSQQTAYADDAGASTAAGQHNADANSSSSPHADLPMVHPGADLPPLPQRKLTEKRVGKFSFVSDPSERASRDFYGHEVPNNTPKPKLPMWASSLTSPALGKVRLVEETWISQDARGTIDPAAVEDFVAWLTDQVVPAEATLQQQLRENVMLDLRKATARGVYAKKSFRKGDVILTIPLAKVESKADTPAEQQEEANTSRVADGKALMTLNSEVLATHSQSARRRPGLPSYDEIKAVLSARRSSFDPIPHPVFIDQVRTALLLACEKADGPTSPLHPYLQLLNGNDLFNDEHIKELHLGVLDPRSHMEYTEHRNRFQHYLRELHKAWWAAYESTVMRDGKGKDNSIALRETGEEGKPATPTFRSTLSLSMEDGKPSGKNTTKENKRLTGSSNAEGSTSLTPAEDANSIVESQIESNSSPSPFLPPPSLEDLEWAFRVVISRQKVLPGLRTHQEPFQHIQAENAEGDVLDGFGKAVMKGKYAFYEHVLHAIDADRLRVNEVDPSAIPTVVPLLDMLNHPPGGVGNVSISVETTKKKTKGEEELGRSALTDTDFFEVVVRAADDVEEDEELTVLYTKCYSTAYTLYRYGFMALGRREDEAAALLAANKMDGTCRPAKSAEGGSSGDSSAENGSKKGWWASLFGK